MRRSPALARRAVLLAAALLPWGPDRDRYRAEFLADLHALAPGRQVGHAVGVLVQAVALRAAVTGRSGAAVPVTPLPRSSRPFRCRVLHRHRWVQCANPDGEPYRACLRCGELHPRTQTMVGSTIPWTPSIT